MYTGTCIHVSRSCSYCKLLLNMEINIFLKASVLFLSVLRQCVVLGNNPFGEEWRLQHWDGLSLYCPGWCKSTDNLILYSKELCCNCHSITAFDFDNNPCRANISSLGEIVDGGCKGNTVLQHTFPKLYKFPDNVCDNPGITKIVFSGNLILDIPNLACLSNLTYLDLSRNKITTLRQASLVNNKNLRFVDLSSNSITHIETGVLESLSFLTMNLRNNSISTLDVTDFMITRSFCQIDISYNRVESIVNSNNWTVDKKNNYGTGFYNGTYNQLKYLPDWNKIGFPNLISLNAMMYRGYDIRHNPIYCDCNLAQSLVFFSPILALIDRDYFYVKCNGPKALTGQKLRSFLEGNRITQLVCNYTGVALCPSQCACVKEPRYSPKKFFNVILVTSITCNNSSLYRLPHILPESDEIEFRFNGSGIKELTNEHYLPRVTVLKLVSMPLFDKMALENLKNLKELSLPRKAQLNGIPKELSFLHPCVFLLEDNFVMNCTCSLKWMIEWLSLDVSSECQRNFEFKCLTKNNTEPARTYLQNIDCNVHTSDSIYLTLTSMCLALLVLLLFLTAAWKRKCEIRLLIRETKLGKLLRSRVTLDQDRVVFISFDGSNHCIHSFIFQKLEPFLVTNGFHVFIPSRDLAVGSVRSEEAAWQISVSRYYITFLSLSYLDEDVFETRSEWRYIWNGYLSDNRKELLVLNYDLLKPSDVPCSKMRAVLRAGNVVDFDAGESTIFSKIVKLFHTLSF